MKIFTQLLFSRQNKQFSIAVTITKDVDICFKYIDNLQEYKHNEIKVQRMKIANAETIDKIIAITEFV